MPRHEDQANCDADTKTKSFSTATQKPSQCDPYTEIKLVSTPRTEIETARTQKWNQCWASSQNHVYLDANTEMKSISIPTQNQANFDAPNQKLVNFDQPHKMEFNSDPYNGIKSVSFPQHWTQVNVDHPQ